MTKKKKKKMKFLREKIKTQNQKLQNTITKKNHKFVLHEIKYIACIR